MLASDTKASKGRSQMSRGPMKSQKVQSKILGDFVPRSSGLPNGHAVNGINHDAVEIGDRIVEIMEKATEVNLAMKN